MDIKDIALKELKGRCIGFFGPMNGGKTREMIGELERAKHSGLIVKAYNSLKNDREKDSIVADGRESFLASSVESVREIKKELEDLVRGEKNVVVGIDEVNLFCLSKDEANEMVKFMGWCKEKKVVLYVAGLVYDFRHMPFGQFYTILPYVDIKEEKKPVCKVLKRGKQCSEPGIHTQRLWSLDFAKELNLDFLIDQIGYFNYFNKEGALVMKRYIAAPFFDKTERIEPKIEKGEKEKDKNIVYLPVCNSCAKVPYKKEVFEIYNSIVRGRPELLDEELFPMAGVIHHFLLDEGWIKIEKDNSTAVSFYKNELGGFSEKE